MACLWGSNCRIDARSEHIILHIRLWILSSTSRYSMQGPMVDYARSSDIVYFLKAIQKVLKHKFS